MDWLFASIDSTRPHEVGFAISWHARSMVLAWGVLAPLAVLLARFFKIMPGQDWPRALDNQTWWRGHWMGQSLVVGLTLFGLTMVLPSDLASMGLHNWLGYLLVLCLAIQVAFGVFRGTKGGPTAPGVDGSPRGDHYDMTPWRRTFEVCHKTLGYLMLFLGAVVILMGLWKANAPNWMWVTLVLWWFALSITFIVLQRRGMAIDTYQAIWGDNPTHPGNSRDDPGWGMRRPREDDEGEHDVRSNRGDRVRSH